MKPAVRARQRRRTPNPDPRPMQFTTAIPTYNRPQALDNCIHSVLAQTQQPVQLIVIDDGELPAPPFEGECRTAGIDYVYRQKNSNPGLTASRNLALELTSGDVILFLDDDVVLDPCFIERLAELYARGPQHVGGVGGTITNRPGQTLPRRLRHWMDILFLNSGRKEGRVLPSGFCTNYAQAAAAPRKITEVDFLPGCAMSFRTDAIRGLKFDQDRYAGYGYGEDKEFCMQVREAGHRLWIHPDATLQHFEAPQMRPNKEKRGRMFVVSHYIFFQRHVRHKRAQTILFWYAMTGYILIRVAAWLVAAGRKGETKRLRGIYRGLRQIIRGDAVVQ